MAPVSVALRDQLFFVDHDEAHADRSGWESHSMGAVDVGSVVCWMWSKFLDLLFD